MAQLYAWFDDDYVAKLAGVRAELRKTAEAGAARAEPILRAHRHQGHAEINVTEGDKLDWFVNLDDTRGELAAGAIEFGRSAGGWHGGAAQGIGALARAFG